MGQGRRAVVVDAADQETVGVDGVDELDERGPVGLLGPPDVEVVGLDVGDDRGVAGGRRGRRRRSRRPRRRTGRRCRRGRCCRSARAPPPTAYVGSAPAASNAIVSRDVVVVLPCVPDDRDHPPALHHRCESGRPRQHPQAPASRLDDLGVVLAGGRGHDDGVGVAQVVGVVAEPDGDARARAGPGGTASSWSSLPVTGSPRSAMIRAMPDRAAPPMPTKWIRPELVGGQDLLGNRDPHPAAPSSPGRRGGVGDDPGELLVGVARDQVGGGRCPSRRAGRDR